MNMLKTLASKCSWLKSCQLVNGCIFYSTMNNNDTVEYLCKYLSITRSEAQYTCYKYPAVTKVNERRIIEIVETMHSLGFTKKEISTVPTIFSLLPITLQYRYKILDECGFKTISIEQMASYLHIIRRCTIRQLKNSKVIPNKINLENRLANYMTNWPTSLTTFINGDAEEHTLHELRLNIIQRYLELIIDLSEDEFKGGVVTYPNIKHRPLQAISDTLSLLTSVILMPPHKLKSNLYLVHADPDNLKEIIYNVKSIAEIDIKEILRMHPKLCSVNYRNIIASKKVLQEYGISNEAQSRCFEIFTLAPETIRERLHYAKSLPEFEPLYHHPRFLKVIHFKNTVIKRMLSLYSLDKKCMSMDLLFGSDKDYKIFEKKPGDGLGKGKDLLFSLVHTFGKGYNINIVRKVIKRHPFWIKVPVVHVKYVYEKLSKNFSTQDIYENCPILLYPWSKIKERLALYQPGSKIFFKCSKYENIDNIKLSKSQVLSLVLYNLEKDHYFTGNGIWAEENVKIEPRTLIKQNL